MYEKYTRQALPPREYREKLGTALCVFNSNFTFVVGNILNSSLNDSTNWYDLINFTVGRLQKRMRSSALSERNDIIELFDSIARKRNRIVHSFQNTNEKGEQFLATLEKEKSSPYLCITSLIFRTLSFIFHSQLFPKLLVITANNER